MYFYNTLTEASSWTAPEGVDVPVTEVEAEPVPETSTPVAGTAWMEVKCTDGRVYFYNEESEVRSREMEGEGEGARGGGRQGRWRVGG